MTERIAGIAVIARHRRDRKNIPLMTLMNTDETDQDELIIKYQELKAKS
jgi:hypothetical protein